MVVEVSADGGQPTSYNDHVRSGSFLRNSCATVLPTLPTVVFQKLEESTGNLEASEAARRRPTTRESSARKAAMCSSRV